MKKLSLIAPVLLAFILALSGCGTAGEKTASITLIYSAMTVCSFLLFVGYCYLAKQKDFWFLLLFSSVFVVNAGYLALSVSKTLELALLSNRISYLGSVCLPLSMLMIIFNVCKIKYPKWLLGILLTTSIMIFIVAASPGYLNIYYKEVTLEISNGVSSLRKVYGPCHALYYFYLFGYFGTMVYTIFYSAAKHTLESVSHAVILIVAVFVNVGVWFIEQFVKIDFEILSISYIISELFLLGLHMMIQENAANKEHPDAPLSAPQTQEHPELLTAPFNRSAEFEEQQQIFGEGVKLLTPTERSIYNFYLERKTTKEIMGILNIKENTLKFHNKNIYSKLGVSSRKQLIEIYDKLHRDNQT